MVTLLFKLSEIGEVQVETDGTETFKVLLERWAAESGVEIGDVIATRDGKVLPGRNLVREGDVIEVFPAISGG